MIICIALKNMNLIALTHGNFFAMNLIDLTKKNRFYLNDVKVADFFARKCNLAEIHKLETRATAKNMDLRQKKIIEKNMQFMCSCSKACHVNYSVVHYQCKNPLLVESA